MNKQKRYLKERSVSSKIEARDKHHLCYQSYKWRHGNLADLRDYWYCIVPIPVETVHKAIHCELPDIPVPRISSVEAALEQLGYLEQHGVITEFDSLERRLTILASLFDCCDQPTADAFKAQIEIARKARKTPP